MPIFKNYLQERNIARFNLFSLLVIIGLLSLSMGYLFISSYYKDFIVEFSKIKKDYIGLQKDKIESQIDLELKSFVIQNNRISDALRTDLKKRTYAAYKISRIISDTYYGQKSEQEIKEIIKNSIKSMRRKSEISSFFINQYGHMFTLNQKTLRNTDIVFIDFPYDEGPDLHKRVSIKTSTQNESFFQYRIELPETPKEEWPKGTMFLKHFEAYNWYIGFGLLERDMERLIKQEIIETLKSQDYHLTEDKDFEIYELTNGENPGLKVLMDVGYPELVGSVLNFNTRDAKNNPYLQNLLDNISQDGQLYIEVWETKQDSDQPINKLMYFRLFRRWNWLITKGFYPDKFEEFKIQKKIEDLQTNIVDKLLYVTVLFFVFISAAILISIAFSRRIGTIFKEYKYKVEDRSQQLAEKNEQLINEISEKALIANSLRKSEDQLRHLASEVQLTEERERRQIASDLHDSIGSTLAISNLRLEMLSKNVKQPETVNDLKIVHQSIKQVIQQTRFLTFQLSPPALYEMGLEAALSGLIEQTERMQNIKTVFEDDNQEKFLEEDIRIHLFRSVRELIVNAIKHAEAKNLKISISKVAQDIQIKVYDDGSGFELTEETISPNEAGGFGLFSIRERLKLLGGHLEIDSVLGKGTHIVITAPLKMG